MSEPLSDDWLEKSLREELPYIDDDGFTTRVVHALPVRRTRSWGRGAFFLAVAILASVIAFLVSGRGAFIYEAIARVGLL